jgi:hypothetical protein
MAIPRQNRFQSVPRQAQGGIMQRLIAALRRSHNCLDDAYGDKHSPPRRRRAACRIALLVVVIAESYWTRWR